MEQFTRGYCYERNKGAPLGIKVYAGVGKEGQKQPPRKGYT